MFKNNLKVIFRIFWQQKTFSFINVIGLASAFAATIIIALFVKSESGWDTFWPGIEDTYRVESIYYFPDRPASATSRNSAAAVDALKEFYPEVDKAAAMWVSHPPVKAGDNLYRELISYAEPEFLDMFKLDFVSGGGAGPLDEMSTIVISESMAKKYFGDEPAMGKTITVANSRDYRVTGVFRDLPENTHLELNMVARLNRERLGEWFSRWFWTNVFVYVKLKPGTDVEALSARLPEFIDHYHEAQVSGMGLDITPHDLSAYRFLPVTDIHLASYPDGTIKPVGSKSLLVGLSVIAAFIIGIAAINFINLSTARASLRAREVGIRKMSGASRRQLAAQFAGEAVLLTFISLLLGIFLAELGLPFVSALTGKALTTAPLYSWAGLLGLGAGGMIIGFLSGFYPAIVLSRARPAEILFSNRSMAGPGAIFRNILVVTQFAIAIGMILATIVLYSQTRFARDFDMGFAKENKLVLSGTGEDEVVAARDALINIFRNNPATTGIAFSNAVPGDDQMWGEFAYKTGVPNPTPIGVTVQPGNPEFLEVYGAKLLAGRLLSKDYALDIMRRADADDWERQGNVVINEEAAKNFGFSNPVDAVGKVFKIDLSSKSPPKDITIVGVIRDMHFDSLHNPVRGAVFMVDEQSYNNLTISFKTNDVTAYLAFVDKTWADLIPERPIGRSFLDEDLNALYLNETRAYKLFVSGAFLAVLISSLGLYGLALFSAERRVREISIRKVHGASVPAIIRMLVWQFTVPVIIASGIALPVAGLLMSEWLQSFVYRIDLGPAPFVIAALGGVMIAWLTVGGHALKAALARPAENLHYE